MYVCNYCKRILKDKYEICPNCGGKAFTEKAYLGETVIKTPPVGGYTINMQNFNEKLKSAKKIKYIGIIIALVLCCFMWPFLLISSIVTIASIQENTVSFDVDYLLFFIPTLIPIIILIIFIVIGNKSQKKVRDDIKKVKELAKNGILVKGISYELISDGSSINGKPWHYLIKVTYQNANGVKIPLISDVTYNKANFNNKPTVDLLIDPNDYSNFYIDYEIY